MYDFLIHHHSSDQTWAEWIEQELTHAGLSVLRLDAIPGANPALEWDRAVSQASRVLALFSPAALADPRLQAEWLAVLQQDPTGGQGALLPVRVQPCTPAGPPLSRCRYLDLSEELPAEAARTRLLTGIRQDGTGRSVLSVFPDGMPPVWNLDQPRNPHFTGREQIMAELRSLLRSGYCTALLQERHALHGLGGVGKTQIAAEYCYRYATTYRAVWWVRSEEPAVLAQGYARLATALGFPEIQLSDLDEQIEEVKRWLERNTDWLLIFDNAVSPEAVQRYLPRHARGHVLITSRSPHWSDLARPVEVQVFERADSVAFIRKRLSRVHETEAAELANLLGDLPLALEQAVAYIDATGIALDEYVERFRQYEAEMVRRGERSPEYPDSVATTWRLAFERISTESALAVRLIASCAFLAPDVIPSDLLRAAVAEPGLDESKVYLLLDEALATLRRYSLVSSVGQGVMVHRLVQAVVRHRLSPVEREDVAAVAANLVRTHFPKIVNVMENWPRCAALLPHACTVAEQAGRANPAAVVRLLELAGDYLLAVHQERQALPLLKQGLTLCQQANLPPVVRAKVLQSLSYACSHTGAFQEARAYAKEALACYEASDPIDDEGITQMLGMLARLALTFGDEVGARQHADHALARLEAALTADGWIALELRRLASVYHDLGDLEDALRLGQRALEMDEYIWNPEDPQVIDAVGNIGDVLASQGRMPEALAYAERALRIALDNYPQDHPEVGFCHAGIGSILSTMGDHGRAREHLEQALTIWRAHDSVHPAVAGNLINLGFAAEAGGDRVAARRYYEEGLAIEEQMYGSDHPRLVGVLSDLGMLMAREGDWAAGRAYLERAVRLRERALEVRAARQETEQAKEIQAMLADLQQVEAGGPEATEARERLQAYARHWFQNL